MQRCLFSDLGAEACVLRVRHCLMGQPLLQVYGSISPSFSSSQLGCHRGNTAVVVVVSTITSLELLLPLYWEGALVSSIHEASSWLLH